MSPLQPDERPSGAELLRQARHELREVAEHGASGAGNDYRARLIAKATVIAARELEQGGAWRDSLVEALGSLLGERKLQDLARLEARLAKEIRHGGRNGNSATYAYLFAANSPRTALVVGETRKSRIS
ncbi:MAG: DUF6285 domain-containing protein [Kiloniellales bacterium]